MDFLGSKINLYLYYNMRAMAVNSKAIEYVVPWLQRKTRVRRIVAPGLSKTAFLYWNTATQ